MALRAAIFIEPHRVEAGDRPDATIVDLEGIADAYAAMDERRAIKSLVRVGTV